MKAFYAILPLTMMAVLATAADTPPENRDEKKQENAAKPLPDQANAKFTYRQRMVTGSVMDLKEADITADGKSENHLLAKVQTYGGHVVIVDLGAKAALKNEIKTGDEIAAFGITGRLNERPLVVANKVATIMPIEGREEIFESVPVNFDDRQGNNAQDMKSNHQFSQEALRRSNENDKQELEGFKGGYTPGQNVQQGQPLNTDYNRQGFRTPCEDR